MATHARMLQFATATALVLAGALAGTARAAEPGKLLVWINGDKGYNGLQ